MGGVPPFFHWGVCIIGNTTMENKRLYTLKEAAQYLGRSTWSMRELIWAGVIPIVRGNGNRKIFIDVKDIDQYIERNKSIYQ